jgi:glycerol-3-phosphate dehydrogenase (NAD(P)+)
MRTAVIGAGSWGTALAQHLGIKGFPVRLWVHDATRAEEMARLRENRAYLPGVRLVDGVSITHRIGEALEQAELVLEVVPSHAVRAVMHEAAAFMQPGAPIVTCSKGIENDSLMTMLEVLEDVLPVPLHPYLAVLSGPSFALELARQMPTADSVAARWERIAREVQTAFTSASLKVYTSIDVVGVELGGAVKNVIAVASGIAEGLGYGDNTRAALITRGLVEISRLAARKGANPLTVSGLSGMGDLVLTCTGQLSRNRRVGFELGRGKALNEILGDMEMIAEGVKNARSVHQLAQKLQVEVPICDGVYRVLYEGLSPKDAVVQLMGRAPSPEFQ